MEAGHPEQRWRRVNEIYFRCLLRLPALRWGGRARQCLLLEGSAAKAAGDLACGGMSVFHDEVEIEDFEYDEETETYSYPCPCGDNFLITRVSGAD